MTKTFKVKLIKSKIGCTKSQLETLRCLGLRRINQEVSVLNNPSGRGQLFKIQHMVEIAREKLK